MIRRIRLLVFLIVPALLLAFLPAASAQSDGPASCAEALAAANGGATTWNGYKIVRAPQRGGSGADVVLGTSGNDDLRGGSGNDLLCGFGGNDTLWGGSSNDMLVGGPGADSLYGESGDDTLYADAQDRVVNGGSGRNQIIQDLPTPTPTPLAPTATPITPTATPVTPTATPEDPLVTRCKQDATAAGFDANAFTRIIVGTEGDDDYNYTYISTGTLVCSFGGNDSVNAMDGTAVFLAGDGNDFLTNLDGGTFNGDGGDDTVSQCYPGGTFNGGAGTNTIQYPMGCGYTQVVDPYARSSSRAVQPTPETPTLESVIPTAPPITTTVESTNPTVEPLVPTAPPITPTLEPVPPTVPATPSE